MSTYVPWGNKREISELIGKRMAAVVVNEAQDEIRFVTVTGDTYIMYHDQDCCESVGIESITGDLADLVGSPILKAEESSSEERPADVPAPEWGVDSETWTFYKLATRRGYVDIRWHGESNGYYSESVDFALLPKKEAA